MRPRTRTPARRRQAPRVGASPDSGCRWHARLHTSLSAPPAHHRAPRLRCRSHRRCSPSPSRAPPPAPCRARSRRTCARPPAAESRSMKAPGASSGRPAPHARAGARTRRACARCGLPAAASTRLDRRLRALPLRGSPPAASAASPSPIASSCTTRSCSIPAAASASSSSRCARDSGVRSAVACTSTRPPSPVITTFASTSAVESSG